VRLTRPWSIALGTRVAAAAAVPASLVLALSACTSAPSSQAAAPIWGDCAGIADTAGLPATAADGLELLCGTLAVPLDPSDASVGTIDLQLIRVHRTGGASTRTPLLLIAGGPGQSGVELATLAPGMLPRSVLDRFDLVGFDPRGVGRSGAVSCEHGHEWVPDFPDLRSDAGYAAGSDVMRAYTEECATAIGETASAYSTTATAVDIDRIREVLGQDQLTYLGWSYGAKLGAEYARLFPQRVRAAVLDAPTDPTATWLQSIEGQLAGFESAFDIFVSWCAHQRLCTSLGDVRAFTRDLVDHAQRAPIPSGRPGDLEPTNGVEVLDAVVGALYDDARWPDLATGIAEAAQGDSGTLRDLVDAARGPDDSQVGDAQFVINCNDSGTPPAESEIRAAGVRLAEQYPLFGVWGSWALLGCSYWTPERHPLVVPQAATAHPLLVVGTRHDPATPYAGAVAMAAALGNAQLLTWEGNGHGAVGRSPCITALVAAYLDALTVPSEASSTCPAGR
jgi:pimeloyl-ACP methyl ester carboxylesterase